MNSETNNQHPQPALSRVRRFNQTGDFEKALMPYQVASAIAYVKVLNQRGSLKGEMADRIIGGLRQIAVETKAGQDFRRPDDADMYSALMRRLEEIVGVVSQRLSEGRNFEDWLAIDVRLLLRATTSDVILELLELRKVLLHLAEVYKDTMIPSYPHMQPGRSQMLSFVFLAWEGRLKNDCERLRQQFQRINLFPYDLDVQVLIEHPFDPVLFAQLLNFDGVMHTSFESMKDLDHVAEFASNAGLIGGHFSQMASELLLWSTQEFGYVHLTREFALASEMFRDKKNTEILEAVRAKGAVLTARLTEIFSLLKGITFAASQDQSEAIRAIASLIDDLKFVLSVMRTALPVLVFDTKKMMMASESDLANRSSVVNYLIAKEFTPDRAVAIVEPLIEYCRKRKRALSDLAPGEWQEFSPAFDTDIYKYVHNDGTLQAQYFRVELLDQALLAGKNTQVSDEKQLLAILEKAKLTVEVPSASE